MVEGIIRSEINPSLNNFDSTIFNPLTNTIIVRDEQVKNADNPIKT